MKQTGQEAQIENQPYPGPRQLAPLVRKAHWQLRCRSGYAVFNARREFDHACDTLTIR